jgi:DNA-binding transcriptional LysR family regulator
VRTGWLPSLLDLTLLVSVAETSSLGQTAARHGLSQPAVSMRMTGLERSLGLRLLRRDASGTRLTPDGEQIVAAARRVLTAASSLEAVADRLRAASGARLRVAASFTVAEHLAPTWIEALRSAAPQVALSLEVHNSSEVLAAVEHHRVDVGFVEGVAEPLPGLEWETVTSDELVVVVAVGHPWARRRRPLGGADLASTELVVRERGSGTRQVLEAALAPWGGVRTRLELGSSAAVLAAARAGDGPAVLSRLAAADAVASGRLVPVAVEGLDLGRPIRAVWLAGNGLVPLARKLLDAARTLPGPR